MLDHAACIEELAKIGAVSDAQARAALERYEALEQSKPTSGQVGRYAGLGAAAGLGVGAIGQAIKGRGPAVPGAIGPSLVGHLLGARAGGAGNALRAGAAAAATGALGMGAIPLVRNHLDSKAEKKTLQGYLQERGVNTGHHGPPTGGKLADAFEPVEKAAGATGATPSRRYSPDSPVMLALGGVEPEDTPEDIPEKKAFATSQYDGGPSYPRVPQRSGIPGFRPALLNALIEKKAAGAPTAGGFLMASEMPAFRAPSLQRVGQGRPQAIVEKLGGVATTPAGVLAKAKAVGAPRTTAAAGPSIAQVAKPVGMGRPMPGATKNTI